MSSQMIQEETIAEGQKSAAQAMSAGSKLTMQVILRRDLLELGWPSGPLMAQAAHAATAVLIKHRNNENVKLYEEDIVNMRKAVLAVPDEKQILSLRDALEAAQIGHYLWIEQPENYATALAIVPNKREKKLKKILDSCQVELWRRHCEGRHLKGGIHYMAILRDM